MILYRGCINQVQALLVSKLVSTLFPQNARDVLQLFEECCIDLVLGSHNCCVHLDCFFQQQYIEHHGFANYCHNFQDQLKGFQFFVDLIMSNYTLTSLSKTVGRWRRLIADHYYFYFNYVKLKTYLVRNQISRNYQKTKILNFDEFPTRALTLQFLNLHPS